LSCIIRSPDPLDYPAIIALLSELAEQENSICRLDVEALTLQVARGQPELLVRVAEREGAVIGCVLTYIGYDVLSAARGLHLSDIIVTQNHRGCGIGTALLADIAAEGLRRELEWMSWTALTANNAAHRFYERVGGGKVNVHFMAMGRTAMRQLAQYT
jgi:ribosomal protein S18 acetylase RimI-like enzyme